MDKQSAKQIKEHAKKINEELHWMLLSAQGSCSADQFLKFKRSVGHVMAYLGELLHDHIYVDYPELNELAEKFSTKDEGQ